MDKLISDGARGECRTRIKDVMRALIRAEWQSEPYQENQHFAENWYATIKTVTNGVLNPSGEPLEYWSLAVLYVG
jgi:hypothetical protein